MFHTIFFVLEAFLFLECFGQTVVSTKSGRVMGKRWNVLGKEVDAYLGIPYAAPPVDNLRFSETVDVPQWKGIRYALQKSHSCLQSSPFSLDGGYKKLLYSMDEDCLYLNIWVPVNVNTNKSLSTMVWIHGGGYNSGSSNLDIYDGSIMASLGGVIVISFNYRLGAFGFFYLKGTEAIGNVGMLDQVKALTWIKHNIKVFGGDANEITLFGQGAGAWAISVHLVSPLSKGLFKRAILQSGNVYHPALTVNPQENLKLSLQLGKEFQCYSNHTIAFNDVLNCMRRMYATSISAVESEFARNKKSYITFLPQIGNLFMPDSPLNYFDNCNIDNVDVMLGNVEDEGSIFLLALNTSIINEDFPIVHKHQAIEFLRILFKVDQSMFGFFEEKYFTSVANNDYSAILKRTREAIGDWVFKCPTDFLAGLLTYGKRKVFHFTFKHKRTINGPKDWMGVPHSEELFYIFGVPFVYWEKFTEKERWFSKNVIQLWTSFAKKGKPSNKNLSTTWYQFSRTYCHSMDLKPGGIMATKVRKKAECEFWINSYPKKFYKTF